jgi:amino acid adenylation domain-containing protein
MAISLIVKLREKSGVSLDLVKIFDYPSPKELAPHIQKISNDSDEAKPVPGSGRLEQEKLALSYGQRRLWALDQLQGPSAAYNLPMIQKLSGSLNSEWLELALIDVIRQQLALRTMVMTDENGIPFGRLRNAPEPGCFLRFQDLSEVLTEKSDFSQISEIIQKEISIPFLLSSDYPIRAILLSTRKNEAYLVLTLHHHASDAVSADILSDAISQAYQARHNNQPTPSSPLAVQYSDWAVWQYEEVEKKFDAQINRIKEKLRDAPELLNLPLDHPRNPNRSRRAGFLPFALTEQISVSIHAMARQEQSTIFTLLLSVMALTLGKLSGQSKVIIGSPVAGRTLQETDAMIGFLVNTMVLPVLLENQTSGIELINQVRKTVESALVDQELPFERLVEGLNIERSLAHTPVFQAMMIYQHQLAKKLDFPGITCEAQEIRLPTAKTDITLYIGPKTNDVFEGAIEYDADLFEQDTVKSWCKSFKNILEQFLEQPNRTIAQYGLLSTVEKSLLAKHARTPALPDTQQKILVADFLAHETQKNPKHVAIIFSNEENEIQLSYEDLDQKSTQFANYLILNGIGAESIVAVMIERSPSLLITLLAINKTGAAYLPIDPEYPKDRISYMLEDSGSNLLITSRALHLKAAYPNTRANINQALICIEIDDPAFIQSLESISNDTTKLKPLVRPVYANNLAYVIYTSGSTGKPKGVCVTHGALSGFLTSVNEQIKLKQTDRWLAVTTISFDIAALEIFLPLITGSTIVLLDSKESRDPQKIGLTVKKYGITTLQATPSLWELMLTETSIHNLNVLTGGEALPQSVAKKLEEIGPVTNLYGPTEATIWASHHQSITAKETDYSSPSPIGIPLAGYGIYILDQALDLVPDGVEGELYISGVGVARGYLGQSALTAQRFIACPFEKQGSRMYRTGDRGRRRTSGVIEFKGRTDDQVKIRGFRVEPGEIENAIKETFKEVAQVVVIARKIGEDLNLVAYLTLVCAHPSLDDNLLRTNLRATLPPNMIPAHFVILEQLPLTPNGKLDKKLLPAPHSIIQSTSKRAPSSPHEILICKLFEEITGTQEIGVDDSFFAVGGHSLSAMRLIARLRQETTRTIELKFIFENPTPLALAQVLEQSKLDQKPALTKGRGRRNQGMT